MHPTVNHTRKGKTRILSLCCMLLMMSIACNLPTLTQEEIGIKDGLVQNVPVGSASGDLQEYSLSDAQRKLISDYGYPNRFILHFFDLPLKEGQEVKIRQESWYYDERGYQIVFRNGETFTEKTTDPVNATGLGRTAYQPERFVRGMSLMDILSVTGESGYFAESMPDGFVEDGKIVFLKGLSVGFENGRLRYVETIPLGNAGVPSQANQPADLATVTIEPSEPSAETPAPEVIIYYAEKEGAYDIFSADYSTGVVQNLTNHPGADSAASCSPDGGQIAFVSDRTGNEEIYLMSRRGENLEQITESGTQYKDILIWISDTLLLYWDGSPGTSGWQTVDINTHTITSVSDDFAQPYTPLVITAPDASAELTEEFSDDETFDLLITIQGVTTNLTNSPGVDEFMPIWSPDSSKILFASDRDGDFELYIMDKSGAILEQFTENTWRDFPSCWLP